MEDLEQGTTRNQMKLLLEYFGGEENPLMRPDALHWDRLVILPHAEKEWPDHIVVLREGWPGRARKHPPVTRLAILLWLERLYPDLGITQCRGLLHWKVPDKVMQAVSIASRLYGAVEAAAREQGIRSLFAEASELARRLFAQGFRGRRTTGPGDPRRGHPQLPDG